MSYTTNKKGFVPLAAGVIAVTMAAFGLASGSAFAQNAQGTAKEQSKPQSSWVKLCDKTKVKKDEKSAPEEKEFCLTHHERLDGYTGMVLVSAAVRKIEGQDKERLMIMVPLGMMIPAGVKVKIDEEKEALPMPYSICTPSGCYAETIATPELIAKMKKGKTMLVAALNRVGKPIGFPVPLNGFGPALDGPAVDSAKYEEARKNLLAEIKKRRDEKLKEAQAQQKAPANQKK